MCSINFSKMAARVSFEIKPVEAAAKDTNKERFRSMDICSSGSEFFESGSEEESCNPLSSDEEQTVEMIEHMLVGAATSAYGSRHAGDLDPAQRDSVLLLERGQDSFSDEGRLDYIYLSTPVHILLAGVQFCLQGSHILTGYSQK